MQFRRQKKDDDTVNLTPLIDVVFLLLIFFMVSTTFTKETHLSLELPESDGEPLVQQKQQIEILINADGSYAINGKSVVNTTLATLKGAIEKMAEGDTSRPMVISADAKTPHQAVVRAMDAAGQLGFVHLSITTKNPVPES